MKKRFMVWVGVWLVLLIGGFAADQPVSRWLYAQGFHNPKLGIVKDTHWAYAVKMAGSFQADIILAAALVLTGLLTWRKAGVLLLCGATSIITELLKWIAGRPRPVDDAGRLTAAMDFVPFSLRDPANSFPSGHAMIAFATAACLARYYPRWRPLFYGLATVVAVERVLELAHHVSDVVAAAGIGVILTQTCMWAVARFAPRPQPRMAEAKLETAEEGST